MINLSQKLGQTALIFSLALALIPNSAAYANDAADELRISSPLFQIDDVWPEKDTIPAIEPIGSGAQYTKPSYIRRPEPQDVQPTKENLPTLSMPAITSPEDLQTSWGYGTRENSYNGYIFNSVAKVWPHQKVVPLNPLLLKSLLACESGFDPEAVSYTGAVGIAQLTPETAKRFGLGWSASRDPQQAIPAGVKVLAEKAKVIIDPGNYHKMMGLTPDRCLYAQKVAAAYQKYGVPSTEQYWCLMLAAYNGGGGTILRAMAIASDRGLDPRQWVNLVGDMNAPHNTPLYLACQDIFRGGALSKYREIANYPGKIIKLYNKSVTQEQNISIK
ncbi:MAG: transglycosylase SLT domain-containing protein [Candidatus Bruticola sp.]